MLKTPIQTDRAPAAIGTYSQAIRSGNTVYLSGQIPLNPATMELVAGGASEQAKQCFQNLSAIAEAAGGSLDHIVKLSVYLIDLADFGIVNAVMESLFHTPYPARAAIGIASLPKGARIEIEAIMVLND